MSCLYLYLYFVLLFHYFGTLRTNRKFRSSNCDLYLISPFQWFITQLADRPLCFGASPLSIRPLTSTNWFGTSSNLVVGDTIKDIKVTIEMCTAIVWHFVVGLIWAYLQLVLYLLSKIVPIYAYMHSQPSKGSPYFHSETVLENLPGVGLFLLAWLDQFWILKKFNNSSPSFYRSLKPLRSLTFLILSSNRKSRSTTGCNNVLRSWSVLIKCSTFYTF